MRPPGAPLSTTTLSFFQTRPTLAVALIVNTRSSVPMAPLIRVGSRVTPFEDIQVVNEDASVIGFAKGITPPDSERPIRKRMNCWRGGRGSARADRGADRSAPRRRAGAP